MRGENTNIEDILSKNMLYRDIASKEQKGEEYKKFKDFLLTLYNSNLSDKDVRSKRFEEFKISGLSKYVLGFEGAGEVTKEQEDMFFDMLCERTKYIKKDFQKDKIKRVARLTGEGALIIVGFMLATAALIVGLAFIFSCLALPLIAWVAISYTSIFLDVLLGATAVASIVVAMFGVGAGAHVICSGDGDAFNGIDSSQYVGSTPFRIKTDGEGKYEEEQFQKILSKKYTLYQNDPGERGYLTVDFLVKELSLKAYIAALFVDEKENLNESAKKRIEDFIKNPKVSTIEDVKHLRNKLCREDQIESGSKILKVLEVYYEHRLKESYIAQQR